jgi:hypothetical protein
MLNHRLSFAAVLAVGLLSAGAASAQSRVWNLGDITAPGSCPTGGGTYSASFGNTLACSMQPAETTTSLTVSAYSNTGTGSTYATGAINYQGTGSGIGTYNQSEGLTGVGSPNHAIDNYGTGQDMVLLSFNAAEVLKSVKLGWGGDSSTTAYDSDFQVLRWTGSTAITSASITGKTSAQLLTAGWSLVTAVDGATYKGSTDQTFSVNTGNLSSSYWLISAYNSAFGGTAYSTGADAFKLLEVAAAGKVSTPGTLALAGLALLAMTQVRRRRSA